jgi:hypothetical protein
MANYKVELNPGQPIEVKIKSNKTAVSSVEIARTVKFPLQELTNVDGTNPDDGEVLVYEASSNLYVVKTIPHIRGGTF